MKKNIVCAVLVITVQHLHGMYEREYILRQMSQIRKKAEILARQSDELEKGCEQLKKNSQDQIIVVREKEASNSDLTLSKSN